MKTSYAITSKLLRVVAVLILQYHDLLTTETEIFLSLIMKFLDPDKPSWQNGSALEVIHKIVVQPKLMAFICTQFDMNEHSTNVFKVTMSRAVRIGSKLEKTERQVSVFVLTGFFEDFLL